MKTLALILLIPFALSAQKYDLKKKIIPASLVFVSGMSDGINQQILFHYPDFKKVFPKSNDHFWNPKISWTNKYELNDEGRIMGEKFPFSSSVFVFTTDGYHATRTLTKTAGLVGGVWLLDRKQKFHHYIIDILIYSFFRTTGFYTTYRIIPALKK